MKLPFSSSSNCTAVAASLSALYNTYNASSFSSSFSIGSPRAPKSPPLNQFLEENGILLTMCMRFNGLLPWLECSVPHPSSKTTKISASWIQRNATKGFRVIGDPIDLGPPVGLVLKPTDYTIRCFFPVDAATDGRDLMGCGALQQDARYGSQGIDHASSWWRKIWIKEQIVSYKNSVFGANVTWDSIDCADFIQSNANASTIQTTNWTTAIMGRTNTNTSSTSKTTWEYLSQSQYYVEEWSYTMGFPVCNITGRPSPPPDFDHDDVWLLDMTNRSWAAPEEFPTVMIDLMQHVLQEHPSLKIWNELVLELPKATKFDDTVQAVFYIKGQQGNNSAIKEQLARQIAKREAKRLNQPLLSVNVAKLDKHDGEDLFQCEQLEDDWEGEEEEEEADGSTSTSTSTTSTQRRRLRESKSE